MLPVRRLLAVALVAGGALVATQGGLWALGDRQQVMDVARGPR